MATAFAQTREKVSLFAITFDSESAMMATLKFHAAYACLHIRCACKILGLFDGRLQSSEAYELRGWPRMVPIGSLHLNHTTFRLLFVIICVAQLHVIVIVAAAFAFI